MLPNQQKGIWECKQNPINLVTRKNDWQTNSQIFRKILELTLRQTIKCGRGYTVLVSVSLHHHRDYIVYRQGRRSFYGRG